MRLLNFINPFMNNANGIQTYPFLYSQSNRGLSYITTKSCNENSKLLKPKLLKPLLQFITKNSY